MCRAGICGQTDITIFGPTKRLQWASVDVVVLTQHSYRHDENAKPGMYAGGRERYDDGETANLDRC